MNPSYLLVRRPLNDAIARYGAWIDLPELAPPQEVAEDDAFDLALEDDQWKGLAVYIFASGPWTVFEEISGGLGHVQPKPGYGSRTAGISFTLRATTRSATVSSSEWIAGN